MTMPLQDVQQSLRHLEIALVAGLVERNENLVRQPPGVARPLGRHRVIRSIIHRLAGRTNHNGNAGNF